jgi:hypothetical protein
MRPPECLALPLPRPMLLRHLVLSIFKSMARTDRVRQNQNKCVRNGRLRMRRCGNLIPFCNSLFRSRNFPVRRFREYVCKNTERARLWSRKMAVRKRKSLLVSLLAGNGSVGM